jgi:hypothetical protein
MHATRACHHESAQRFAEPDDKKPDDAGTGRSVHRIAGSAAPIGRVENSVQTVPATTAGGLDPVGRLRGGQDRLASLRDLKIQHWRDYG